MIQAYTGQQVRAAERPLLDDGLGAVLMRRAASCLARACEAQLREVRPRTAGWGGAGHGGRITGSAAVVLVGSGHNGGDGLWAGALLRRRGVAVTALLTGIRAHREGLEALLAAGGHALRLDGDGPGHAKLDVPLRELPVVDRDAALELMRSARVLVDAMLGTGASGGLRGAAAALVTDFAAARGTGSGPRIVACDIVSGVDSTTGEVPGPVLRADVTVTFGAAKVGHVVAPGEQAGGRLAVVPIGIEDRLGEPDVRRIEASDTLRAWPRPTPTDTKYSRGVLGVVAGAPSYPGAAIMCTHAAVNAGAGMVRFLGDASTRAMVLARSPEVVCSDDQPWDVHVQAWLAGPGVVGDQNQDARVRAVIEAREPAVLDAGALTAAAQAAADGPLGPHKILTPHAGELEQIFAWLKGFGIADESPDRVTIESRPVMWARRAATLTGATVLLKGATTVIASPVTRGEPLCVSVGGASAWLATAGSGDTLAGILGTVVAHVAEHPDLLASLGRWARGDGRWAAAAALGASLHSLASRASAGPVPPTVLAGNVRQVLGTTG